MYTNVYIQVYIQVYIDIYVHNESLTNIQVYIDINVLVSLGGDNLGILHARKLKLGMLLTQT